MQISIAADIVGVPTHVLRHWEDEGVIAPGRSDSGQRVFTGQHVDEARIVHRLRQAGVGLTTIRQLRSLTAVQRRTRLVGEAERLSAEAQRTEAAAAFLRHTADCRHAIVEECLECWAYAGGA